MSLTAAQLIYTNVDKKMSPSGRDGYQIWLKTPGVLDDREETEIQSRLSDYEERKDATIPKDEKPVRHSYFALSSGRIVLARTVPLPETDEFKRGGRFYAHALVVDAGVFLHFENDPFAILDQFQFQGSLEEGKKIGDVGKGAIPPVSLNGKPTRTMAAPLSHDKLPPVLFTVLRACPAEKPVILGASAPPPQLLALLRQVFLWLPSSLRAKCSFDTLSTGRSLTQLPFAVAGLPVALTRRYPNLLMFDMAKLAFTVPAPQPAPATYDQWMAGELKAGDRPPEPARNEAAYQLGSALDGGQFHSDMLNGVDAKLFEQLVCSDAGVPKLERMLWPRLQADVGNALAPMIYSHGLAWLRGGGLATFKQLGQPLDAGMLLGWVLAAYENRAKHEIQMEVELPGIKEFLEKTKNIEVDDVNARKRLVLIYYRWAQRWSSLAKSVCEPRSIPDELYCWFVAWSLRTLTYRVEAGCGPTARGAWCGPSIVALDESEGAECQNLLGALLGQAKLGEGEAEADSSPQALPTERWAWVHHYLLQQVRATAATETEA